MTVNMYKVLQTALVEKDVENAYKESLRSILGHLSTIIPSPHGTDGVVYASRYKNEAINLIMLLECKYDVHFNDRLNIIKVLVQALYYLNRFEYYGDDLPTVIMVGDKNECFCIHSNSIKGYLDFANVDWTIAPSTAAGKNPKLIKAMMADEGITPYIFNVDENFQFEKVIEKAIELSKDQVNFVRITEKNIDRVFNEFVTNVLYHKKITKELANKLVNVFLSILINPEENFLHPNKPQTLVTKDLGNVRVDRLKFKTFFRHFEKDYTPKEKDKLTAICDRLIEDTTRRFQGEFFTPTPWVEEAHRMIEKEFGEDWKDKYVVWDPAWGTGNLTRDYKFKELYVSTLNASDIGLAEQRGYNPEAVKFQYDFLNDTYDKLPEGLRNAIEGGKKIVVLMNPPYGTANNLNKGTHKGGIAKTKTNLRMNDLKLGKSSHQLYAQFLFRLFELNTKNNIHIAVFSNNTFIVGTSYIQFRELFQKSFTFLNSMLFNASHFSNTSSDWGILFSLWSPHGSEGINIFPVVVKDIGEDGKVEVIEKHTMYNLDGKNTCSDWVKIGVKGQKSFDAPQISSPLKIKQSGLGKVVKDSLCYYVNVANNLYKSKQDVFFVSSTSTMAHGTPVTNENFDKCVANFTARKAVKGTWVNNSDEFMIPDTNHPEYAQWKNDCIVYSLFNNHSNQSSLRNVEYKGKTWDIKNQCFWMSRKQMLELANTNCFDALYQDARTGGEESFVFNKLKGLELSIDALGVLLHAKELVEASFEFRETLHQAHPEYHLNTWDAGWYQIKLILKEFMPDRLKEFREAYKAFEDRMCNGVYEFGFLKQ